MFHYTFFVKCIMENKSIEFSRSPAYNKLIISHLNEIFPKYISNIIVGYYTIPLNWIYSNTSKNYYCYTDNHTQIISVSLCNSVFREIQIIHNSKHIHTLNLHGMQKIYFDYPFLYIPYTSAITRMDCRNGKCRRIHIQASENMREMFENNIKCVKKNVFYAGIFDYTDEIKLVHKKKYSVENINVYMNKITSNIKHCVGVFDIFYKKMSVYSIMVDDNKNITVIACDGKTDDSVYILIVYDKFMNVIRQFVSDMIYCLLSRPKILYSDTNEIIYTFIHNLHYKWTTVICYRDMINNVYREITYVNEFMHVSMTNNILTLQNSPDKYRMYVS